MRSVRLSEKHARAISEYLPPSDEAPTPEFERAFNALRTALAPRPKSSAKKKTEAKRRTKREETSAIREAVFARAGGRCESCSIRFSDLTPGEMDHFFGRGKVPQSEENCWALCRDCHRAKTDGNPDAAHWCEVFLALVAEPHGYRKAAARARNEAAWRRAKKAVAR